jgi:PAS domain S-box-containing protein
MKLRLKTRYALAITAIIIAASLVVVIALYGQFHRSTEGMVVVSLGVLDTTLGRELETQGRDLAEVMAPRLGEPLARGDRRSLAKAMNDLVDDERTLRFAAILDEAGRAVATAGTPEAAGDLLTLDQPILQGDHRLGTLRLGFTRDDLRLRHQQMEAALRASQEVSRDQEKYQLAGIFLLMLVLGVLLGVVTAHLLAQPVSTLAHQARYFAAGDLHRPLEPVHGDCEITELAGAFEQMRRSLSGTTVSRDFLSHIIDGLHEGLVVTGPHGEIRMANRAAAEMSGYSPSELTGMSFPTLVPESDDFTAADHVVVESTLQHRHGAYTPIEISRSRLDPDALGAERVYVISNITARKAMEEELWIYRTRLEQLVVERTTELTAAIQELESFSYSVSHDLHAPLRAINGFGAALIEEYFDLLGDTGRGYLDRMNHATVRMGELIDGLLTLSRVARREINREPVELGAIASEVAAELVATDPRRQVTFRIAPKLHVLADRTLMRLLMQNLVGNAWKFSRLQPNALIEVGQTEREGRRTFFVRDNGAGFEAGSQGLFQPFHRLHSSKEFPGTGIGLATVQRIVLRHGGEVWAEAGTGAGATFYFTLPDLQVEESRVSSRTPLSKSVSSQRPSRTA